MKPPWFWVGVWKPEHLKVGNGVRTHISGVLTKKNSQQCYTHHIKYKLQYDSGYTMYLIHTPIGITHIIVKYLLDHILKIDPLFQIKKLEIFVIKLIN